MRTTGQKILITGGGSGIGLALARRLAVGNDIAIVGRSGEKLARARHAEPSLRTLAADVGSAAGARAAVDWAATEMGAITLLVNNAGVMRPYPLDEPHAPSWAEEDIRSNLIGPALMTAFAVPYLRSAPEAAVVFVSSAVAFAAAPGWAVYGATKAGVHSLARSLRPELEANGIKVFDVAPPIVDTASAAKLVVPKLPVERIVDEVLEAMRTDRDETRIGRTKALAILARIAPRRADSALARALGAPARGGSVPRAEGHTETVERERG